MKKKTFFFFVAIVFSLLVRLYIIDSLPGEWFGDISNVHEYVTEILAGNWPFSFFQSPGPFYHYLITPIVFIFQQQGYETYKIASIIVSLLGLIGTYLFIQEIGGKKLALITVVIMSVSFWYMVWSRLGNSQIVIPAIISLQSYFTAKYLNTKRPGYAYVGAITSSLGWYTYPQTFIFPVLFFVCFIYIFFRENLRREWILVGRVLFVLVFCAVPFVAILQNQVDGNFSQEGYIGQKILPILSAPIEKTAATFVQNFGKYLLMFHVRGDVIFRSNISLHPHLDKISGIMLILGFFYFIQRKRRIWLLYIVFMLLVLPLPSLSPVLPEGEIPSSSRTIAIIPFVYLLVAAGLVWIYQLVCKKSIYYKSLGIFVILTVVEIATYTNLKLYFGDYARGLPDKNLAPGKIIAQFVDQYPSNYALYFSSCCWGEWGEPEPKAVTYVLRKKRVFASLNSETKGCGDVVRRPALVAIRPDDKQSEEMFVRCFPHATTHDVRLSRILVAKVVEYPYEEN